MFRLSRAGVERRAAGCMSGGVTDKHVDVKIVRRKTASFFPSPSLCDEMTLISDITFDMPRHAAYDSTFVRYLFSLPQGAKYPSSISLN